MAHLSEGALRRMFDDPDSRTGADSAHLEGCAECQARFGAVADDARAISALLAVPDARVDVPAAFARVTRAPKAQPALGLRLPLFRPARPALALVAALAAAAVVVVAFAFSGFFYKPQTVQTVPVTVADIQALAQLADYGTVTWTKQPDLQVVTSASDASAAAAGLQAPVVSSLPKGVSSNVTYAAMPQAQAVFTFSAAKAEAAAARQGKTLPKLPAGMDGATLTVTVGPAIAEIYGNLRQPTTTSGSAEMNLPQLVVARSTAPTATSTQVTVQQLESYILSMPGISNELKNAVKAVGDPSTTLLIPVPVQYATSTQVTVQGSQGVALGDNTGLGSAVVWVKNGYVYVVAGSVKQSDALSIADNLK